jgi:hypothetical protein
MDEVKVVVAHSERATLRVGDVFLKVDVDQARIDVEVEAMSLAPVPTPEVLWRKPPVLAIAALPGTTLGRLGGPSTGSSAAWAAAGAAIRKLHDAPLPPRPGRAGQRIVALAAELDDECELLVTNGLLPADLVTHNRQVAEAAGLQILTPDDDSEFLIGDAPAFTRGTGPQGPAIGMALGDASTALLPLGPRHLLALSHSSESLTLPWPAVMEINILQVLTAHDRVFLRPGSGLQELVRSICHRREELCRRSATQETE